MSVWCVVVIGGENQGCICNQVGAMKYYGVLCGWMHSGMEKKEPNFTYASFKNVWGGCHPQEFRMPIGVLTKESRHWMGSRVLPDLAQPAHPGLLCGHQHVHAGLNSFIRVWSLITPLIINYFPSIFSFSNFHFFKIVWTSSCRYICELSEGIPHAEQKERTVPLITSDFVV